MFIADTPFNVAKTGRHDRRGTLAVDWIDLEDSPIKVTRTQLNAGVSVMKKRGGGYHVSSHGRPR